MGWREIHVSGNRAWTAAATSAAQRAAGMRLPSSMAVGPMARPAVPVKALAAPWLWTGPGQTSVTATPRGATSRRSVSKKPCSACLLMQ